MLNSRSNRRAHQMGNIPSNFKSTSVNQCNLYHISIEWNYMSVFLFSWPYTLWHGLCDSHFFCCILNNVRPGYPQSGSRTIMNHSCRLQRLLQRFRRCGHWRSPDILCGWLFEFWQKVQEEKFMAKALRSYYL